MEGKGVLTFADSRRYEGEFHKDLMNGEGIFTWPDGHIYAGVWK
jgi:hypothetical protein